MSQAATPIRIAAERPPTTPRPAITPPPPHPPEHTRPPPEPEAPQTASLQGDLVIDGAQMGRWLADAMGRQAARPPTSARRFNSRMAPIWPGLAG
ncbi:hypothetical protein [Acidisoma silvae]|uniref:Uncharacterized protein n=1 Tax=Acidisoma silvae TaxID=2802396 RepID=A0A964DXY6_9PROT|nr:hypothetical protein [Acidisoma silvae]MCB8874770.1 hypothetical protein [Acidisoma silvae]